MLSSKILLTALIFGAVVPHTLAVRYDANGGSDTIVVNDNFAICDVDVEINMRNFGYTIDPQISVSVGGRSITLLDFECPFGVIGSTNLHVVFDDDASTNPIDCSSVDSTDGSAVQPFENFASLNGEPSQGTWQLIPDSRNSFVSDALNQWAVILTPCGDGAGTGDPHFKTWANKWYDFHGACDLVFISNPKFSQGTGLEIHIRTKARYQYSFIESAAVQIGIDILEVGAFGGYMLNGISNAELEKMDKYTVTHEKVSPKQDVFTIELGEGKQIVVQSFKDLVSVKTVGAGFEEYGDSMGLLGEFGSGKWLARNGTVMSNADDFGMEWQVLESEPKLFQTQRVPQRPVQCTMPSSERVGRRGLGESIAEAAAEKACEHWGDLKDQCVYDVMAAGDLELAEAGAF
ncbi:expressed unknown protein [Seminavis robusta]|uniref:VWFD domain-containing protein n=1 Tax=Seminavis robusta TaxID=568900 RepID=A0A9N8F1C8_9STRA|nr:expressed unknown protein [Seminavis robusta]|eukprot:Sro2261_g321141.1  (404) ;mRNA; r:1378-2589